MQWLLRTRFLRMAKDTDRALDRLTETVERTQQQLAQVLERAAVVRAARAEGRQYDEIVRESPRPLLVERLTDVLEELATAGAAFRRAEARVLHEQGMSQEAIGTLFGVSRQRVSVLLKER